MSAVTIPVGQSERFHKRYPPPTARLIRHPFRWARNTFVKLGLSLGGTHIAIPAFVALYYILFETVPEVKQFWDTLLSQHIAILSQNDWDVWRHFLRNGGEAYLASLAVLFFTFNPYTHKFKAIHTGRQVVGRCLISLLGMLVVAIPVGLLLHGVQSWFHTGLLAPALGTHPNLAQKLYSDQWTTKASVVVAAVVTRRLMYPVYAFTMGYFSERRVARGKKDRWFQAAPYRAMVRGLYAAPGNSVERARRAKLARGNGVTILMSGGLLLTLALAGFGYYVLLYIA